MYILGEPPPTQADLRFNIGHVPVRVHPIFWLVAVLLGIGGDIRSLPIWVIALFVSILFHEMGHAWVAIYFGASPRVLLWSFGGLCIFERSQTRGQSILILLAGPGAGFLLAGLIVGIVVTLGYGTPMPLIGWVGGHPIPSYFFSHFVWMLLFLNIIWGLVNLLPVYPLDGGQVSREIFTGLDPTDGHRKSLILSCIAAFAMAFYGFQSGWYFVGVMFFFLGLGSLQQLQNPYGGGGYF